jgi:carbon-monoxide dehydrogenase large subunit
MVFIPIENPQNNAPFGARGMSEHPRISIEPVIANAIYDAVGADLFEIPMTRERVWNAIQKVK